MPRINEIGNEMLLNHNIEGISGKGKKLGWRPGIGWFWSGIWRSMKELLHYRFEPLFSLFCHLSCSASPSLSLSMEAGGGSYICLLIFLTEIKLFSISFLFLFLNFFVLGINSSSIRRQVCEKVQFKTFYDFALFISFTHGICCEKEKENNRSLKHIFIDKRILLWEFW